MIERIYNKAAAWLLLAVALAFSQVAGAALLGISLASDTTVPYASGGNQGTLAFTSGNLVLNGFASRWTPTPVAPASYGTDAGYLFAVGSTTAPATLKLNFNVSPAGVVSSGAGNDLVLTGDAYAGPPSYALQYSGVLLTGKIVSMGWNANSGFGTLDMRFKVTGGAMASLFGGKDIGLRLDLEATTFTGSFAANFTAGRAKPTLGGIGQLCVALEKQVSVNGTDWFNADAVGDADVPVAAVPSDAHYRMVATNCGTAPLVDVTVSDPNLGLSYSIGNLAAGASQTVGEADASVLYVADRCSSAGTQINSAQVTGKNQARTETRTASDDAVLECVTTPKITLKKQISVDGGATWLDADTTGDAPTVTAPHGAEYRFIVTNTGTADLTGVVINDATLGITNYAVGDLAVGASVTIGSGDIPAAAVAERCANPGEFTNIASTSGQSVDDGSTVNDSDAAVLVCAGQPMLQVRKEISVDGGATWADANQVGDPDVPTVTFPHGAQYRFIVTNVGEVALQNVVVKDPDLGIDYAVPGILAAGSSVTLDSGTLPGLTVATRCDASATITNVVSASGSSVITGDTSTASDTAVLVCTGEPAIQLRKQVSLDGTAWADANDASSALEAAYPADAYYRFLVSNIGSVDLTNVQVSDSTLGVLHTIGDLAVGQSVVVDSGTVGALYVPGRCAGEGILTNVAQVTGDAVDTGSSVSDSDAAVISCVPPPPAALGDFVWLDLNQNGAQDAGEAGVDDVRVDLLDLNGNVLATQLTSGGGKYLFDNLQPGSYRVRFYPPSTLTLTQPNAIADDALDSDADTATGETGVYTLAAGETNLTVDAGLYPLPTDCGCEGKVTSLTLRYMGDSTAHIKVVQKKDGAVVFDGDVAAGASFSFDGADRKGTLTTEIYLFVNGKLNTSIHTSCSQPIGPGLVSGDFEVVSGSSRGFATLCPVDQPPPDNPPPSNDGGTMGCTPGYWRQKQHYGNWVGYSPNQAFGAVFEDAFPSLSLGQVVRMKGGGLNALGRHTVAALLNAASPDVDYGMTPDEVIAAFNAVYPGSKADYEALKDKFAAMNERGCPLSRASSCTTGGKK